MGENNRCLGLLLCCLAAVSAVRIQQPGKLVRGKSEISHKALSMLEMIVNSVSTCFLKAKKKYGTNLITANDAIMKQSERTQEVALSIKCGDENTCEYRTTI